MHYPSIKKSMAKPANACELHNNRDSSPHILYIRTLPATNLKPKMMDIYLPPGYGRMIPRFQYFAAKIYTQNSNRYSFKMF